MTARPRNQPERDWPRLFTVPLTTPAGEVPLRLVLDESCYSQGIIGRFLAAGSLYEPVTSEVFLRLLEPGDAVIDGGAHVGWFTLISALMVGPRGQVLAFEPFPGNRSALEENLVLNGLGNCVVEACALGEEDGSASLYVNLDNEGGHALWEVGRHNFNLRSREQQQKLEVAVRSLDSLLAADPLQNLALVKLDVEGAETAALRGARRTLEAHRWPSLVVELNAFALQQMGSSPGELRDLVADWGYGAYFLGEDGPEALAPGEWPACDHVYNLLFVHGDRRQEVEHRLGLGQADGGTAVPRGPVVPDWAAVAPRSFIIPVLDESPHSPWSIHTLLRDLEAVDGEVICVFNDAGMHAALANHPRIDKFCLNSANAGVSRSWNMGINLAESPWWFILNADLHLGADPVEALERALMTLPDAVVVGPEGSDLGFDGRHLAVARHYRQGDLQRPQVVDNVSGFCMAVHGERWLEAGLGFDMRFSPCFMEEWDLGLRLKQTGLKAWVVPVAGYAHEWGISSDRGQVLDYLGHTLGRDEIMERNARRFAAKWFGPLRAGEVRCSG